MESLLGLLPLGDVANDLRCANDSPQCIVDRRPGYRHVDQLAALCAPDGFVLLNPFSVFYALQNSRRLINAAGRDDGRNRVADHLFGRIAEDTLSALVPTRNDSIQV